ncbi:hypothetical protein [Crinalium epipsammum]|nr:hypothetical protein [Crinalium epipsammum]
MFNYVDIISKVCYMNWVLMLRFFLINLKFKASAIAELRSTTLFYRP